MKTALNESILIIEDDKQISHFIQYTLKTEGYRTAAAANGIDGLAALRTNRIDLVLLDLGLPDMDGLEVLKRVRENSEVPLIVVSARDQIKEKADALDMGADDYLTKPFSSTELLARIRVALRHAKRMTPTSDQTIWQVGELTLDPVKHLVTLKNEPLHVTPKEYTLLTLLFKHQGKVIMSTELIRDIWGTGYGSSTQALRALMAGLRRKIEENSAQPRYITTEIGVGYRLADE